jgi:uncharacterized UBP type Zn finger protein
MTADGPSTDLGARGAGPNGSAPRCEHLDVLVPVAPNTLTCRECQAAGEYWADLVVCLTCGWVACSDDSPRRHAFAHYEETDHPVVRALQSDSTWKWCYVHRRAI